MKKEEINEILEYQGVYEIVYRKDDDERIWHISNIEVHKDYEGNVITAYCHELERDINFSISKIVSAKRYWIDILDDNDVAPQSGIYLFVCRGDNHLITELYRLDQGERLYKYFEGEYDHSDGWFEVIPLAYHFVCDYKPESFTPGWLEIPDELQYSSRKTIRIVAFKSINHIERLSFVVKDELGVQYHLLDTFDFFGPDFPFNLKEGTNPLSLYTAFSYTEMNHRIHWDLYNKAHPKAQ